MVRNKQPEQLARHRIDKILESLGWRLDGDGNKPANVRFERDFPNPKMAKKLGGGSPDYHLYSDDSDMPIAIIEAKKPHHRRLSEGLKQAERYARALGNPNMVVFVSDGAVILSRHMATNAPPMIGGEILQEFLPPERLAELAKSPALDNGKAVKNIKDLVAIFRKAGNLLRQDGVEAGMDSLREFCLLLFVKIMLERDITPTKIATNWKMFSKMRGNRMLEAYHAFVEGYRENYSDVVELSGICNATTLEEIVDKINDIDFERSKMDVKGGAYEHFLSRYSMDRKSVLGQYFTPRHITRMMSQMLNPRIGETIYDPFCGTGGMLVACYDLLRNQIEGQQDIDILNKNTLFGGDISKQASQLAKMNMILLGDGHSNIYKRDNIRERSDKRYDHVITNIPFNMESKTPPDLYKEYGSGSNGNETATLHCLHSLKPGGKAAIIIPENMAYDQYYDKLRRYVCKNSRIRAVIRLPKKLFVQYTAARTCLLLLDGVWQSKTEKFPAISLQHDGFSQSKMREPTPKNDIPTLLEAMDNWEEFPNVEMRRAGGNFFVASSDMAAVFIDGKPLKDYLRIKRNKTLIKPEQLYVEPSLNSHDNTVSARGKPRLGSNIKQKNKIIACPGDLIIGTLHTQQRNGLFAFADREYVATSQIVAEVLEDKIDKEYLAFALRRVLPSLATSDLVGRETYKPEDILALKIPPQPADWKQTKNKMAKLREKIAANAEELKILEESLIPVSSPPKNQKADA